MILWKIKYVPEGVYKLCICSYMKLQTMNNKCLFCLPLGSHQLQLISLAQGT